VFLRYCLLSHEWDRYIIYNFFYVEMCFLNRVIMLVIVKLLLIADLTNTFMSSPNLPGKESCSFLLGH